MISCRSFRKAADRYRDGRLTGRRFRAWWQHRQTCSSCAAWWRLYERSVTVLKDEELPQVSPYFTARVLARTRSSRTDISPSWLPRPNPSLVHLWPALAVLASASLVLVGTFWLIPPRMAVSYRVQAPPMESHILDTRAEAPASMAYLDRIPYVTEEHYVLPQLSPPSGGGDRYILDRMEPPDEPKIQTL